MKCFWPHVALFDLVEVYAFSGVNNKKKITTRNEKKKVKMKIFENFPIKLTEAMNFTPQSCSTIKSNVLKCFTETEC